MAGGGREVRGERGGKEKGWEGRSEKIQKGGMGKRERERKRKERENMEKKGRKKGKKPGNGRKEQRPDALF